MQALLDANVLISYLLRSDPNSPITLVVKAALRRRFTLLLPGPLLTELHRTIGARTYLKDRVSEDQLRRFIALLQRVSEPIPPLDWIPLVTRDPKDDYLLAYGAVGGADYIVTGDGDLLTLHKILGMEMVTPRDFWQIVRDA